MEDGERGEVNSKPGVQAHALQWTCSDGVPAEDGWCQPERESQVIARAEHCCPVSERSFLTAAVSPWDAAAEQSLLALKRPPLPLEKSRLRNAVGTSGLLCYGESWRGALTNSTTVLSISANDKSVIITWGTKSLTLKYHGICRPEDFPWCFGYCTSPRNMEEKHNPESGRKLSLAIFNFFTIIF